MLVIPFASVSFAFALTFALSLLLSAQQRRRLLLPLDAASAAAAASTTTKSANQLQTMACSGRFGRRESACASVACAAAAGALFAGQLARQTSIIQMVCEKNHLLLLLPPPSPPDGQRGRQLLVSCPMLYAAA